MPFFSLDLLPLTHFRALKPPIPTMREHFSFPRSFFLGPGTHIADFRTGQLDDFRTPRHSNTFLRKWERRVAQYGFGLRPWSADAATKTRWPCFGMSLKPDGTRYEYDAILKRTPLLRPPGV